MSQNQNQNHNYEDQIKSQMRDLNALREKRKRQCNHKPNAHGQVINVHDTKFNIPNKKDLPDSTVACTRCEKYFESSSYNASEIESGIYMFNSMAEQVKINANLDEQDWDTLEKYYEALDTLAGFETFYLNMVEKLSNGNGNKKNKNRSMKGHMGVSQNMFNRGF